jgi:hypothetical protein
MPALTKEQIDAWSKRNKGAFEGLLNVNQFVPVTGDIQSGIMVTNDLSQGNYGSAALNAVGLLPFVPALGGVTKKALPILDTLNPTGVGSRSGLHVEYNPQIRATQPLSESIVPIYKTMGGSPDDLITIYRGAPKNQKKIVPGDFITDMPELAKSYTGDGNVLSMQVRRGDVLDDIREPLGNEYIYRPNADKGLLEVTKKKKK